MGGSRPLRVVALDHFFGQDLSELERSADLDLLRVSYQLLRRPAMRLLGHDVADRMSAYDDPHRSDGRARWEARLDRMVRRLHRRWPFDVVILPSDTLFYVRSLPDTTKALGVPTVVVQRETTISPDTLDAFSLDVRAEMPFLSHFMTACSDIQREFWIRAGADPERIVVTGQPRFDRYHRAPPPRIGGSRRILFLSYHLDAYEPGVGQGMGKQTWRDLRDATEQVLVAAARNAGHEVLVKPHPQQPIDHDRARLRALAGDLWNTRVRLVDRLVDTRDLIAEVDTVVGFQTTAMYEAVAAGRPTIYTAWGDAEARHRDALIPFHEAPAGTLVVADSPSRLASLIDEAPVPDPATAQRWFSEALGPIDGHATQRVVQVLHDVVRDFRGESSLGELPHEGRVAARAVRLASSGLDAAIRLGGEAKRRIASARGSTETSEPGVAS